MTDEWGALLDALEKVRAFAKSELTEDERTRLDAVISDIDQVRVPVAEARAGLASCR
ncbi:MAG: hypothetical protein ACLQVI_40565 [Polyangiaceae bacterium]